MKEKEQGYAILEEVTPDTFDRFLQWIYQGYYTAPQPILVEALLPTVADTSNMDNTNGLEIEGLVNEHVSDTTEPMYGWGDLVHLSNKKKRAEKVCKRLMHLHLILTK